MVFILKSCGSDIHFTCHIPLAMLPPFMCLIIVISQCEARFHVWACFKVSRNVNSGLTGSDWVDSTSC